LIRSRSPNAHSAAPCCSGCGSGPAKRSAAAPSRAARDGSGSSATIGGSDRLGSASSENLDQWASDYAAQHNGRITRQEFLDQIGNRWDVPDTQHCGYLTPQEMHLFLNRDACVSAFVAERSTQRVEWV
jgi:hypothetical protein